MLSATAYYRYETGAGHKTRLGQNFLYKGVYNGSTSYAPLDVASIGSTLYVALVATQGVAPTLAIYDENWAILVQSSPARLGSAITITDAHSPYSVMVDVRKIYADATEGSVVIDLEAAPLDERIITVKATVPLADLGYSITINGNGHDIDVIGQADYILTQNYESITLEFSSSTNRWQI
jgi:hypothetical protein